ncbi:type II secretion system protein N [Marinicella sp. S1101]|uniref:type II secretion system protein N n=1 Tax=Marinicella marina TaxID=2996016 RepID=UPI002260C945|nr:type II secretion system protein N [Marinicella marina]MCX7554788.1 type II secretion system protein N [Marinicella marina]MDJ1140979.1 type II secretion system protein N [Marinicella marina]
MLSSGDRLGKLFKFVFIIIIIAVLALAVAPLNLYYDHVKQQLKPVALSGISGSAVKGAADSLTFRSAPLGRAEWLLYPNSLNGIGGKVRVSESNYDMTFELKKVTAESQSFKKVTGFINWALIKPFLQIQFGQLDGYAQVNMNQVEFNSNGGLDRIEGEVTLRDFMLTQPRQLDLGTVTLTLSTQKPGIIVGNFTSQSQAMNVSGALYIQPRRWQLKLDIIPKAGFYELDAVLNSVGDARRGGGRVLNLAGFY